MARLEPRPKSEPRSPLSPATLEVLRRLGSGTGGLLFLTGDDRIARTRLLQAVGAQAEERHLASVKLRAHPLEACSPYGALLPWFAQWYRAAPPEAPEDRPTGLDASFFTALAGLIATSDPSGAEGGPAPSGGEEGGPRPLEPAETRAQLLRLVEGRSRELSAVVTVEEAEFLDPASREWLSFLGERLPRLPVVVVLSLDPHSPAFDRWQKEFQQVTTTWERWPPGGPSRQEEPSPASLVKALPHSSQEALAVAALAGPDARIPLLSDVLGRNEQEVAEALAPAREAGLLHVEGGSVEVLDPRLYPDLAGSLGPERRRTIHQEIAYRLEAEHPGLHGSVLFRLAEHWYVAGDPSRGVPVLMAAARESVRWGSPELAEVQFHRAIELAGKDPSPRGRETEERVWSQLGEMRLRSSNPKGAAEALGHALSLARDREVEPLVWARYVSGLATAQTRLGLDTEELLKATLQRITGRSANLEATLLCSLGFFYRERGKVQQAVEVSERACTLADPGSDVVVKVLAHLDASEAYFFGGEVGRSRPERCRSHLETALSFRKEIERSNEPSLLANVLESLSHLALTEGNAKEAMRRGEEALVAARRMGTRSALLLVLGNQAETRLELGDLPRARELASELRKECDRLGLTETDVNRQQLILVEGRIAQSRGAFAQARRQFELLASAAKKGGTRYYLAQAFVHLAATAAQQGDREGARAHLDELQRQGLQSTLPAPIFREFEELLARLGSGPPAASKP